MQGISQRTFLKKAKQKVHYVSRIFFFEVTAVTVKTCMSGSGSAEHSTQEDVDPGQQGISPSHMEGRVTKADFYSSSRGKTAFVKP